jgi:hypothetical protein
MIISPRLEALITYFATADPKAVNKLAYEHGYEAPQGLENREGFIVTFLDENGDQGLQELMKYHPDKDAILSLNQIPFVKSNADGPVLTPPMNYDLTKKIEQLSSSQLFIVTLIIIFAIYLIFKSK